MDDLSTLPLISKLFFAPTLTSVTLVLKDTLKSHNIRNPVTSIAVGHIDMAVGDSLQHFRSLTQSSQNVLHHFCLSPATPKVLQQLSIFPCLRSLELHSYWDQYVHTHLPAPVVANLRTLSLHFEFNLPFERGVSFDSRCDRNIVYPELIELKLFTNNDFHARRLLESIHALRLRYFCCSTERSLSDWGSDHSDPFQLARIAELLATRSASTLETIDFEICPRTAPSEFPPFLRHLCTIRHIERFTIQEPYGLGRSVPQEMWINRERSWMYDIAMDDLRAMVSVWPRLERLYFPKCTWIEPHPYPIAALEEFARCENLTDLALDFPDIAALDSRGGADIDKFPSYPLSRLEVLRFHASGGYMGVSHQAKAMVETYIRHVFPNSVRLVFD